MPTTAIPGYPVIYQTGTPTAAMFAGGAAPPILANSQTGFEQLYIINNAGEVIGVSAINGIQSTVNTTTTPLGGSATYTGTYEQNALPDVCVSCFADVAGTLYFDFSPDGTNTNTFPTAGFVVSAGVHEFHTAVKAGRYFRARFINGSGAQSAFRLYTYYGLFRQANAPLDTTLSQDSDALTVRAVDSILDISASRFGGFYPITKFGRAPDGVQTTSTDIWDRADATPTQQIWTAPTTARVHAIVSSQAADASGSTGARTVVVFGLTSWSTAEVSETITMNGLTPVNTANSYVIIHRMRVATTGSGGTNAGTITATAATDATITAQINVGNGTTEMAIYGWPSTQKLYVTNVTGALMKASGTAADLRMRLLYNPEPNTQLAHYNVVDTPYGLQSTGTNAVQIIYTPYLVLNGPGILKMNAIGSAADMDTSGRFNAILVDNT